MTALYNEDRTKWSSCSTPMLCNLKVEGHNLLISVKCSFGDNQNYYYALFDTGAEWSVIPKTIVDDNPNCFTSLDTPLPIWSRFGKHHGELYQCAVNILVDSGEDLTVEATVMVIQDWCGPVVLGFKSFLDKIRWACDPTDNLEGRLYFGRID